jgi:hypothetical protein
MGIPKDGLASLVSRAGVVTCGRRINGVKGNAILEIVVRGRRGQGQIKRNLPGGARLPSKTI